MDEEDGPLAEPHGPAVPVRLVPPGGLDAALAALPPAAAAFARATGFDPKPGRYAVLPDAAGGVAAVVLGVAQPPDPFAPGALASDLPPGTYRFEPPPPDPALAALAWALEARCFTRYRAAEPPRAVLRVPEGADLVEARRIARAVARGRDLIDTPAADLGPAELEAAARDLAAEHGARVEVVIGEALERGFPMVQAVGRASSRPPRLIDLTWGREGAPRVTLVGKGVTFDTGGLNLKPGDSMTLMKKDMGGAASALTAADLVMGHREGGEPLDLRLRVILPAADNAVSGDAFRPGDVLRSRRGLTVEVGNTDAEGRLLLADALAFADEEAPDLLIDLATLTGAARVALGPDLPPLYTDDEALADGLLAAGTRVADPLWRMPLWRPYAEGLSSKVADVNHISPGGFAGSITAALFLTRFVERARSFAHLDIYGWVPKARPGRQQGGEPQAARAIHAYLAQAYLAGTYGRG